jgi:hypothetical protein
VLQDVVSQVVLGAGGRSLADGEWGLTVPDVGTPGWSLDIGVRLHRGVLHAKAFVAGAGSVDDHELLVRNRALLLVRFAHTGSGDVWLVGELMDKWVDEASVDRLLGLLVAAAADVRALIAQTSGSSVQT